MTEFLFLPIYMWGAIVTGDNLTESATYINPTAISINVINNYIQDVEVEFSIYNDIFAIDDRIISVIVEDYDMSIDNTNCYLEFNAFVNSSDRIVIELTLTNGDAQFYNSIEYENSTSGFIFSNSYYTNFNFTMTPYYYYSIYMSGNDTGYKIGYNKGNNDGYDTGYDTGYDIGSMQGYNEGYNEGYKIGIEDNEEPFSIFRFLERVTATIANLLNTQIFPNITIGTILFIPIILKVVEFIVGWFR